MTGIHPSAVFIGILACIAAAFAQEPTRPLPFDPVGRGGRAAAPATPTGPAPKRDLTGIWLPALGAQGQGAANMPADGKPEHELPYTAKGLEIYKSHKTANGPTPVPAAEENDPGHICDPLGFPRANLYEMRATQFIQTPVQTVMLYTYDKVWRSVWTDGRELPKDPDPRWFGYSVGKWKDDYTFVIDTIGTDERTWVDNAGRPHSEDLHVTEEFHRIDQGTMELTMTIDDPQMYSKPWVALKDVRFRLLPPETDLLEMLCSPSESQAYNKRHADPVAGKK
mgnify:CR=1 FL=1